MLRLRAFCLLAVFAIALICRAQASLRVGSELLARAGGAAIGASVDAGAAAPVNEELRIAKPIKLKRRILWAAVPQSLALPHGLPPLAAAPAAILPPAPDDRPLSRTSPPFYRPPSC